MSEREQILAGAAYSCTRCGKEVSAVELEALPSPRCSSCGFTVFRKTRPALVKRVAAV